MFSSLRVEGFRCLTDITLSFEAGQPLVLIGENGSGKSAILEALVFLEKLFSSLPLDTLWMDHGGADAVFSRAQGAARRIRFTLQTDTTQAYVYTFSLLLTGGGVYVDAETLHHDGQLLLERSGQDGAVFNASTGARDAFKARPLELVLLKLNQPTLYPWREELVSRLQSASRIHPRFAVSPAWAMVGSTQGGALLRPLSSTSPQYEMRLARNGSNVVNVLYTLHAEQPSRWELIQDDFRAEFARCKGLRFGPVPGEGGRIRLQWYDQQVGDWTGLEAMSDGMVSYLMMLAAVHGLPDGALLAIDEPELHLHPRLLLRVTERLCEAASRARVLITTHSDALLDALPEAHMQAVRMVRLDPTGTTLHRLDAEALGTWREQYGLGTLRAMGKLRPAG